MRSISRGNNNRFASEEVVLNLLRAKCLATACQCCYRPCTVLNDVVYLRVINDHLNLLLRSIYSDTSQLNSTELNWTQLTQLNSVQPSQSCFGLWRHDLQTESTGSLRSFIGDSCSRCERVDNSTSSWVQLSCVAINTPLLAHLWSYYCYFRLDLSLSSMIAKHFLADR